jgi:hypothetical protein
MDGADGCKPFHNDAVLDHVRSGQTEVGLQGNMRTANNGLTAADMDPRVRSWRRTRLTGRD